MGCVKIIFLSYYMGEVIEVEVIYTGIYKTLGRVDVSSLFFCFFIFLKNKEYFSILTQQWT